MALNSGNIGTYLQVPPTGGGGGGTVIQKQSLPTRLLAYTASPSTIEPSQEAKLQVTFVNDGNLGSIKLVELPSTVKQTITDPVALANSHYEFTIPALNVKGEKEYKVQLFDKSGTLLDESLDVFIEWAVAATGGGGSQGPKGDPGTPGTQGPKGDPGTPFNPAEPLVLTHTTTATTIPQLDDDTTGAALQAPHILSNDMTVKNKLKGDGWFINKDGTHNLKIPQSSAFDPTQPLHLTHDSSAIPTLIVQKDMSTPEITALQDSLFDPITPLAGLTTSPNEDAQAEKSGRTGQPTGFYPIIKTNNNFSFTINSQSPYSISTQSSGALTIKPQSISKNPFVIWLRILRTPYTEFYLKAFTLQLSQFGSSKTLSFAVGDSADYNQLNGDFSNPYFQHTYTKDTDQALLFGSPYKPVQSSFSTNPILTNLGGQSAFDSAVSAKLEMPAVKRYAIGIKITNLSATNPWTTPGITLKDFVMHDDKILDTLKIDSKNWYINDDGTNNLVSGGSAFDPSKPLHLTHDSSIVPTLKVKKDLELSDIKTPQGPLEYHNFDEPLNSLKVIQGEEGLLQDANDNSLFSVSKNNIHPDYKMKMSVEGVNKPPVATFNSITLKPLTLSNSLSTTVKIVFTIEHKSQTPFYLKGLAYTLGQALSDHDIVLHVKDIQGNVLRQADATSKSNYVFDSLFDYTNELSAATIAALGSADLLAAKVAQLSYTPSYGYQIMWTITKTSVNKVVGGFPQISLTHLVTHEALATQKRGNLKIASDLVKLDKGVGRFETLNTKFLEATPQTV
eukprot:Pgem_evm1s3998